MTTASPSAQARLLDLQRVDSAIAQLEHRLRTLPERAQVADDDTALAIVRDKLVAAQTEIGDLERAVRKAEADVDAVRVRAAKDEELLISGSITSPKQLEELQHEVASLARRRADLEDAELEVMELLESATSNASELTSELDAITARREAGLSAIAQAEADAATERSSLDAERSQLAGELPADLLALYERIRADQGGVGAALLRRGSCEGCRLQLPPSDVARIRSAPDDEVVRCEECRRILVRTSESGL